MRKTLLFVFAASAVSISLGAQAPTPRTQAPIDLTGNWVSIVTEDWRFRMVTPPKGDYASVPLNAAARAIADKWDPAKDEADGNACKSYGAANIMRVPGRLHISWQNDNTLKIETDAGQQTRLFHFDGIAAGEPSWQGYSTAEWEFAGGRGVAPGGRSGVGAVRGGTLKVITTRMKEGYVRKNGVPYSEHTVVTEYFDRHDEVDGTSWFTVTTIVSDSKYLTQDFVTSTHFKREPTDSQWNPRPCKAS
jgi:hypothetical protein